VTKGCEIRVRLTAYQIREFRFNGQVVTDPAPSLTPMIGAFIPCFTRTGFSRVSLVPNRTPRQCRANPLRTHPTLVATALVTTYVLSGTRELECSVQWPLGRSHPCASFEATPLSCPTRGGIAAPPTVREPHGRCSLYSLRPTARCSEGGSRTLGLSRVAGWIS
jgi:hypothetical protein